MAYLIVKSYSTSAASNNSTPPDGFPENMAASQVNNAARQLMAGVAELYQTLPLSPPNFRLSLTSGTAVTTSDVTAATTLYAALYNGNRIWLYDGSAQWNLLTSAEMSIAVPATTNTMYDVFCYDNSGTPTLELLAWTNDTTRATALTTQNGVLVKSGATTRRYLGSFRTTGSSGQTEDSLAKRYVWNYYNRIERIMQFLESTDSWTYTTDTYRQANNSASAQLDYVVGVSEYPVTAEYLVNALNSTNAIRMNIGIGVDSTTTNSAQIVPRVDAPGGNNVAFLHARYKGFPGIGRHTLVALEKSQASGTTTWLGDNGAPTSQQTGIIGSVFG